MNTETDFVLLKETVQFILNNAVNFNWTVQGLGMMRCYITPQTRLHIWSRELVAKDASRLHTHPWDFESTVITGGLENKIFEEDTSLPPSHERVMIQCGEGGGPLAGSIPVALKVKSIHRIPASYKYTQHRSEIHDTVFEDYTVTLVRRTFYENTEHAFVYWPKDGNWGSAEPRPAEIEEVHRTCQLALQRF